METRGPHERIARRLTDALNPFFVFTALYTLTAFSETMPSRAALLLGVELAAAAVVAGYVFVLRRRRRVGDFWISTRSQRVVPSIVLLSAFVALLISLALLDAPEALFGTTLSMGLASASIAALTLLWKASAHSAVAGHAAVAGPLVLGPLGLIFAPVLAAVLWSRVALKAHTLSQALAGTAVGAAFALLFLA